MPGHQALASGTVLKSIECAHGKYGEEFLVSQAFIAQKEKEIVLRLKQSEIKGRERQ